MMNKRYGVCYDPLGMIHLDYLMHVLSTCECIARGVRIASSEACVVSAYSSNFTFKRERNREK